MKLYKVKLNSINSADSDQIIDGYLGNAFGNGKIMIYPLGWARKKARIFGGSVELHKEYITSILQVIQINHKSLSAKLLKILAEEDCDYEAQGADYPEGNDIFNVNLLNLIENALPSFNFTEEEKQELYDLQEITGGYDFFQIIY